MAPLCAVVCSTSVLQGPVRDTGGMKQTPPADVVSGATASGAVAPARTIAGSAGITRTARVSGTTVGSASSSTNGTSAAATQPIGALPDVVHAGQWGALRAWVDALPVKFSDRPSVLDGWSIDELISHLARSVEAIASLRPADGQQPITVLAYLTGFGDRSEQIRQQAVRTATGSRADRGGDLDAAWNQATRTLIGLQHRDRPVLAPGGVILLSDFLSTRLVELVVHGFDLRDSVAAQQLHSAGRVDVRSPVVLAMAVGIAADTLRRVCVQKAGAFGADQAFDDAFSDELTDERLVRLAAGRDRDHRHLSADLAAVLPLF